MSSPAPGSAVRYRPARFCRESGHGRGGNDDRSERLGARERDRLEAETKARGLAVFARIDHAAGAAQAGLALRPTELLIFGNAKGGTPLMQSSQTIGIDLPLKALVWQDTAGKTWLSYNQPSWLAKRHGAAAAPAVEAMTALLGALARKATTSP